MTDLTARLAAIEVELPEVDEWERVQHEDAWTGVYCDGTPVRLLPEALCQAALAALVGELERTSDQRMQLKADIDVLKGLLEKAEAENARLRVCGTCGERGGDYGDECCRSWLGPPVPYHAYRVPENVTPTDPCHFDPPRYKPYWEEP